MAAKAKQHPCRFHPGTPAVTTRRVRSFVYQVCAECDATETLPAAPSRGEAAFTERAKGIQAMNEYMGALS